MEFIIEKILEKAITESNTVSPEQLQQIVKGFAKIFRLFLILIFFFEAFNWWQFYRLEKKIKKISKKLEKTQKNS